MGNSASKTSELYSGVCVCEGAWRGGEDGGGGVGATTRREGYSLTTTNFRFVYDKTLGEASWSSG